MLSILPENWHTWYLGGADSKSALRFLKYRPQNSFLGKFGPEKWKLSILLENRHPEYGEHADSYSDINFLIFLPWVHFLANLGWKSQNNYVDDFISSRSLTLLQFTHCVPYVVFMFCQLVILERKKHCCSFCVKVGRVSRR